MVVTARRSERGSVGVAALVVGVALCAAFGAALAAAGGPLRSAARMESVADLVATAAVAGGPDGADRVARRNGVRLVDLRTEAGGLVTVVVDSGSRSASASARPAWPPPEPGSRAGAGGSLGSTG